MMRPLQQRLSAAAESIFLGDTIYSDQVHGLLVEAADALDSSADYAMDRVANWMVRRLTRAQRATLLSIDGDGVVYAPAKRAAKLHELHLLLKPNGLCSPTALGHRVIAILRARAAAA